MSVLLDIAEALATQIGVMALDEPVTVARRWLPRYDLDSLSSVQVSVVPKGRTNTVADRVSFYDDFAVDVAVQQTIGGSEAARDTRVGQLMTLAEQIAALISADNRPLPGVPGAAFVSIESEPVLLPDHLEQFNAFTSVMTVTYRVRRSRR